MKTLSVKTQLAAYPIHVAGGLLPRLGTLLQDAGLVGKCVIVTQKNIAKHYLKTVESALKSKQIIFKTYLLPEGEKAKTEKELFKLYAFLLKNGMERRDFMIALGGGVTGDLTGFAAATYLRGIAYVQVATTLLAQVDSAIGGKTGINLGEGKNLIGAFYPPKLVLSDVRTLMTLPEREFRASLAEVIKYGVIRSGELFRFLEDQSELVKKRDERTLEYLVLECARIKAQVVTNDEFETKGERMILNLGHTFGHAFERLTEYSKLLHGEAVGLGMSVAARLAVNLKMLSDYEEKRLLRVLETFGLCASLESLKFRTAAIITAMQTDKKKTAGRLRFVLPTHIGDVMVRDDIPLPTLQKALREVGAK